VSGDAAGEASGAVGEASGAVGEVVVVEAVGAVGVGVVGVAAVGEVAGAVGDTVGEGTRAVGAAGDGGAPSDWAQAEPENIRKTAKRQCANFMGPLVR
jgi:hypothetical protein